MCQWMSGLDLTHCDSCGELSTANDDCTCDACGGPLYDGIQCEARSDDDVELDRWADDGGFDF